MLLHLSPMPILRYLRYLKVGRAMSLDHSVRAKSLCHGCNSMMLHMARLNVLGVACDKGQVFAFFVLKANFPTGKELWPWLHVLKTRVLEWSFELAAHNVFKAVVGDDVVVSALILHRNGLFHQTTFLELVAVNKRSTKSALLIRCEVLCKVGVDFTRGIRLTQERSIKRGVFVLVIRIVDVVAQFSD